MTCTDCDADGYPLEIIRGKTTRWSFGYASDDLVFRQISAATQTAPCVLTVTAHGLPDDWVFEVQGAKGMVSLNQEAIQGRIVDEDHIELTNFNALNLPAYTGGGVIAYAKPLDLTGYTARMSIRRTYGDAETVLDLIPVVNVAASAVEVEISDEQTASLMISKGVYDIELVNGPEVEELARGTITVQDESTDG